MIFALIGSLIVTLTLLPVLCSWFMRNGVRERRNAIFEAIKTRYTEGLDFCLARPWRIVRRLRRAVGLSLLLIAPFIGAEFMPQLDEGALWVRATMPYTHLLRRSGQGRAQGARILRSFPEVTTVASELGRPDDGTDPTGFFNVEFYVGLKPYCAMGRAVPHQAGADRSHQPEARRPFPASSSTTPSRPKTRWTRPRPG